MCLNAGDVDDQVGHVPVSGGPLAEGQEGGSLGRLYG